MNGWDVAANVLGSIGTAIDSFLGAWFGQSGSIKSLAGRKYTLNDFEKDWGVALSKARAAGSKALQDLQNRLDSLPQLPSGSLRNAIFKSKKSLQNAINQTNKKLEVANATENQARSDAAAEEANNSLLSSWTKHKKEDARDNAEKAIKQYSDIETTASDVNNYY